MINSYDFSDGSRALDVRGDRKAWLPESELDEMTESEFRKAVFGILYALVEEAQS